MSREGWGRVSLHAVVSFDLTLTLSAQALDSLDMGDCTAGRDFDAEDWRRNLNCETRICYPYVCNFRFCCRSVIRRFC